MFGYVTKLSLALFVKMVTMTIILSLAYILVYNVHLYASSSSLACGSYRLWDIGAVIMHLIPWSQATTTTLVPSDQATAISEISEQHLSHSWLVASTMVKAAKYVGVRQLGPVGLVVAVFSYLMAGPQH